MTEPRETSPPLPRVLIVDDSRMVRAIIAKQLRGNFEVREEADGEAGWEALLLDPTIQVVVTDHAMPKLDGYGLIERIRASRIGRIRVMPVIMISGDEDEAVRLRAKELGANDFITKGIGTAELLTRLATLVKLARTHDELQAARGQGVVDQDSGLLSRAFLMQQAEQAMSQVRRHGGQVSAFVIAFDRLEATTRQLGEDMRGRVLQQFARMLAGSIRREDTLARWSDGDFAVFAANSTLAASLSFATRVCRAVEAATIRHGSEQLHLTVSVGIANSQADRIDGATALLDLAERRVREAAARGGNRVLGSTVAAVPAGAAAAVERSVDEAIARIARGDIDAVRAELPALGRRLLPLLRLLDAEYRLGLPLASIEERCAGHRAAGVLSAGSPLESAITAANHEEEST
jgi:diguanylate cyclase (GGDEF)-like protein